MGKKSKATTQSNSTSVQCCFAPGVVWGACMREIRQSGKKEVKELSERRKEGQRERGDRKRKDG